MRPRVNNLTLIGARLIYKNFAGAPTKYNKEGDRNFSVLIEDPSLESSLIESGWNVKVSRYERDGELIEIHHLPVKVSYAKFPPIANLILPDGRVKLDQINIGQLDWTKASNVDLIISPFYYDAFAGHPAGIAAYLKSIYVTPYIDDLESKYADIPFI